MAAGMETETRRLYENGFLSELPWTGWLLVEGTSQGTQFPGHHPWESPLETIHFLPSSKLIEGTFGKRSVIFLGLQIPEQQGILQFPTRH